ncbi:MAG: hypothetical protein IPP15_16065, partial [Saprospiraceae bacterium]|nr:hypothetical protein [Candidatus Opimibacter skivensis]
MDDDGLGKPSAKFEFDDETDRKDFLDELKKINWEYNVKLTTGGTGGKPKAKTIDKSIFDDAPQATQAPDAFAERRYRYIYVKEYELVPEEFPDNENELTIPVRNLGYGKDKGRLENIFYAIPDSEIKFVGKNGPKIAPYEFKIPKSRYEELNKYLETHGLRLAEKPKYMELDGLSGRPWARFDFKNNDEMRRFTEKIEHLRWGDSGPRLDFKPAPAPPPEPTPSIFPTDEGARVSDVWLLPVSGVKTDTARFQNRKSEFSEASVERIV